MEIKPHEYIDYTDLIADAWDHIPIYKHTGNLQIYTEEEKFMAILQGFNNEDFYLVNEPFHH